MDKTEELARIIAFELTGLDPESLIFFGEPPRTLNNLAYAVPDNARPVWREYALVARSILDAGFAKSDDPDPAPESYVQTSLFDRQESSQAPSQDDDWRGRMGLA